jgi:HK97 family phage prohead protease/HK97 family phage major capsid protein
MSNKTKIFHWTNTFKTLGETEDGGVDIKGSASTNALDRAGDIIEAGAWTKGGLDNFSSNPIILFNHDYNRPIGKATGLDVTNDGLEISARISKAAGDVKELVKDGVLGAFSVGFRVKDADYMSETDGYKIKDAELFEVSVVSVPCNQGATFSVAKSFDSMEDYDKFKKQFIKANSEETADAVKVEQPSGEKSQKMETDMSEEMKTPESNFDLEKQANELAEKAIAKFAMQQAEEKAAKEAAEAEAAEKAAKVEAEEKAAQEAKQEEQKTIVQAGLSGAERLMEDVEKRVLDKHEDLKEVVDSLEKQLAEKSEEIMNIRESKRIFSDRTGQGDWKKAFEQDIVDAKFAGLATGKGWDNDYAKSVMQKVNQHSGIDVSSADFEQIVSTNVERDIQNELVLAPLFREIPMTSANMIIPILPDAGYAEFTGNAQASGSAPHGNLDPRGDAYDPANGAGIVMTERTLSTKKLISQSYLGNETEEDAIMPILPLIRESMVRSHARAMENAILAGDDADGAFGTSGAAFEGLLHLARNDSDFTQSSTAFASDTVTAAELLGLRKNMGKYGVNPSEVVYIVSQTVYFQLLEDAEFQDANLVGDLATKINGEIGQVYGSRVLLCDEFAAPATSKFAAIAVNPRNFVMPRLRGVTVESDYEVANQRRVLVASQRIGFTDLIDGATSKWAYMYKAS